PVATYTLSLHDALPIFGLHQTREAGRSDTEGHRRGATEDLGRRVDVGGGLQDVGVELDVFERLAGALHREFLVGCTIGVVERCGDRKSTRLNSSHVKIS